MLKVHGVNKVTRGIRVMPGYLGDQGIWVLRDLKAVLDLREQQVSKELKEHPVKPVVLVLLGLSA